MQEQPPLAVLARVISDYVGDSMRDLIGRARPRRRPLTDRDPAQYPADAPPTIDDLDLAGTEWAPLFEDDEDGYQIARDNGYVVIRGNDPATPIHIIDEADWDAFTQGDTTDGWPPTISEAL